MALVAAKCPNCGGNLEVDASKEAGICPFCNTAYITQKAIVNYNTSIVNNNYINAEKIELSVPKTKKRKIYIYNLRYSDRLYTAGLPANSFALTSDCVLFLDDRIIDTYGLTHTLTIEVDASVQHMIREKRVLDVRENKIVVESGLAKYESLGTRTVEKYSHTTVIPAGEEDIWIVEDGIILNSEEKFLEYKEKKNKEDQEKSKVQSEQYKSERASERAFKEKLRKKWTVIFAISIIALIVGVILIIVGSVQMSFALVAGFVITAVFGLLIIIATAIFKGTKQK